ncbi:HDOD domain-containing protein [Aquipuribacter sp. MA13-6]|uniref:HDOD domain-containing protein n=1 Tax=unclassified Aquipuribacter TaxID=2635084 RepID=UPI003EECD7A6
MSVWRDATTLPGADDPASDGGPWDSGRGVVVLEELLGRLDQIPTQRAVAHQIVRMTRDDDMSARRLAAVLGADAPLTARLMRLANSAYYGLSGRVRTVPFAVTVLGFTTVRSLAMAAAAGLGGHDSVPAGFWHRSACTAVAAAELARPLRVNAPDAFCLGLLVGIGQALLHRVDRDVYSELLGATTDRVSLLEAERARYGASHVSVSATALAAWAFPPDMPATLRVVDRWPSSRPTENGESAAVCLLLACAVAERIADPTGPPHDVRHLSGGRVGPDDVASLVRRVPTMAADLVRAVTG